MGFDRESSLFHRGAEFASLASRGLTSEGVLGDWFSFKKSDFFGSFAPVCWVGAEGFAQYFKNRKQLKLGFCEPMVCDRFLLWGIAGSLWVILEAIVTVKTAADWANDKRST